MPFEGNLSVPASTDMSADLTPRLRSQRLLENCPQIDVRDTYLAPSHS